METYNKEVQSENAPSPIDDTENGIKVSFKFEQLPNEFTPIDVTEKGIFISLKLEHP